jgi:hypothetical protein
MLPQRNTMKLPVCHQFPVQTLTRLHARSLVPLSLLASPNWPYTQRHAVVEVVQGFATKHSGLILSPETRKTLCADNVPVF